MLAEKVHNFRKLEGGSYREFYYRQFGISYIFIEFHLHIGPSGFKCCVLDGTHSMSHICNKLSNAHQPGDIKLTCFSG
jgi:hypothetical protein